MTAKNFIFPTSMQTTRKTSWLSSQQMEAYFSLSAGKYWWVILEEFIRKRTRWKIPPGSFSRATRIRTLKWRSQSPLPYRLAIALRIQRMLLYAISEKKASIFFNFFHFFISAIFYAFLCSLFPILWMFHCSSFFLMNFFLNFRKPLSPWYNLVTITCYDNTRNRNTSVFHS